MFLGLSVHVQKVNDVALAPITDEGIHSEGTLVMRNGIDVAVAPPTGGDPFVLIVGRLHLEFLQDVRHGCRDELEGPSCLYSHSRAEASYMYLNACLPEADGRPLISGVRGPGLGGYHLRSR
jgi:hypothetical protein